MYDPLQPHGLQPASPLCPWDSTSNTGFLSPGYLPDPEMEPMSPALAGRFFTIEPPGKQPQLSIRLFATTSSLGWTLTRLMTDRELVAATPSLGRAPSRSQGANFLCGMMWGPLGMISHSQRWLPMNIAWMFDIIHVTLCHIGDSTGLGDGRPASHSDFLPFPLCSTFFFPPFLFFLLFFLILLTTFITKSSSLFCCYLPLWNICNVWQHFSPWNPLSPSYLLNHMGLTY